MYTDVYGPLSNSLLWTALMVRSGDFCKQKWSSLSKFDPDWQLCTDAGGQKGEHDTCAVYLFLRALN